MSIARALGALLALALAAGCGAPARGGASTPAPATSAPTAAATLAATAPSAAPPPATSTSAPTVGATLAPPATATRAPSPATTATGAPTTALAGATPAPPRQGPLPAPLYTIDPASGQVVRVARDGRPAAQVTFEAAPVLELAVAAEAGTIAYIFGEPGGGERTLVILDGGGRRERLSANISGLVISPDGQRLVYRLDSPAPGLVVGQDGSPAGVWSSAAGGPGRPGLVVADAPADGEYDPAAPAWRYAPVGFSPDGARLALFAYDVDGPAIPGGELVVLGPGPADVARGPSCCELPAWSGDGAALLSAGGGPGPDLRYGLFRLDAATGAEAPLLEQAPDGAVPLVTAPLQLADGRLFALVELAPADGFGWEHPFRPRLARIAADGAVAPLSAPLPWPAAVLWAADAGGAVVAPYTAAGAIGRPAWVPADGAPAVALAVAGQPVAWVPAAPLSAGDCALFAPVGFQEPAARQRSAAARDVQARLAALGFDPGAADGYYGDQTRAAARAFQRDRGLAATGDVDCATWQALLAEP